MKKLGLTFLFLTLLFALGLSWGFQSVKSFLTGAVFSHFSQEHLETDFKSFLNSVHGSQKLQVAELEQMERLTRTSRRRVFWEKLELPSVVVAIEVPVTYTYLVDLQKKWEIQKQSDDSYLVVAPSLEFNKPAADISALEVKWEKSSLFRKEKPVARKLLGEMSGYLLERAGENIPMVRELARKKIEESLARWPLSQQQGKKVQVLFRDEVAPLMSPE